MSKEKIEKPKSAEEIPAPPEEPSEENEQKPTQTDEAPPEDAKEAQPEETPQESVEEPKEKPPSPVDEAPKVEEHVEEIKEPKEETKEEPVPEAEQTEDEGKEVSEEPTAVGEKEAGKDREESETDIRSTVEEEAETEEQMDEVTVTTEGVEEMASLFMSSEMVVEGSNASFTTDEEENLTAKYQPKVKAALGSTIDIRKSAQENVDRRMAKYANTYQLDSNNPFRTEQINKILKSVMDEALNNLIYDSEKCIRMAKWASLTIKNKTKLMEFDRYKIISYVSIGEKKSQDMLITCRSFWDIERDKFCCYSTENNDVYGIALCFGLYYE